MESSMVIKLNIIDNTTKQDRELEINNANFTISAVLENTNIFAFDSYKSHNEMQNLNLQAA
jgi:hypothetical protein